MTTRAVSGWQLAHAAGTALAAAAGCLLGSLLWTGTFPGLAAAVLVGLTVATGVALVLAPAAARVRDRRGPPAAVPADEPAPAPAPAPPDRPLHVLAAGPDDIAAPWWQPRAGQDPPPAPSTHRPAPPDLRAYPIPTQIAQCPACGGFLLDVSAAPGGHSFVCRACAHTWTWTPGTPWPAVRVDPARRASTTPPPAKHQTTEQ